MAAPNMRERLDSFERERATRRRTHRAGTPTLAIVAGADLSLPPEVQFTPAETAAEAEGLLTDYMRCDEAGRRTLARVASDLADGIE
jgi:hypothetical protein